MFEIEYFNNFYYLVLNKSIWDEEIAQYLKISIKEYLKIIRSCNGIIHFQCDELCIKFQIKQDAERAIELLEPYLIMKKLLGG